MFRQYNAWLKRHPRLGLLVYGIYMTLAVVIGLEIALRVFLGFDPSYYMAYRNPEPGTTLNYPYGVIKINSERHADEEFEAVKTRPRIGYFGDSVCFGVGAGYGYRVSEVLEESSPEFEHMNLSFSIGSAMRRADSARVVKLTDQYELDHVVYLMNLNDVLPDAGAKPGASAKPGTRKQKLRTRSSLDWLRGRSYLYTYVRMLVKNSLVRSGYNATGFKAFELFPSEFPEIFDATTTRVNELAQALAERGTGFVVVLLPYEMQISKDAEKTYTDLGIRWEGDSFIDRGPQRELVERLEVPTIIDGYYAFVDPDDPARNRDSYSVGECFVYDRGDKLDWNHPNRLGHRLLAEYIDRQSPFGSTPPSLTSRAAP